MGNIIGVPVTYAARTTLTNESGLGAGLKEVVAFRQLKRMDRKSKKRLDLYDFFFSEDYVKMGIHLPPQEDGLEHKRLTPKCGAQALDKIFFCGFNSKNESLVVNISCNGDGLASACLHMSLSNGKCYSMPLQEKLHHIPRTGKDSFVAGGLRLKCLFPMRKWRISFSGLLLEEDATTNTKNTVYVKFSFIWNASSYVFDVKSDIPTHIMAKFLSTQTWNAYSPDVQKYLENLDSFVQAGNMSGTVQVEGGIEEIKHFWGARKRTLESSNSTTVSTNVEYFAYMTEGEMLYFGDCEVSSETSGSLQFGCIVMANSMGGPVESLKISSGEDLRTSINFARETFSWTADFDKADISRTMKDFQRKQVLNFCPVTLNGMKGRGLIISSLKLPDSETKLDSMNKPFLPVIEEVPGCRVPLVLSLKDLACRNSEISGGKGSSLADLHLLSEEDKSFAVPKGVAVTTTAYELFIRYCNISGDLERLQMAAGKLNPEDFRRECERVSKELEEHSLPKEIRNDLQTELMMAMGSDFENMKVAVRSSATGEDSEDMSAAGQMKTFLGVQGLRKICEAVVKCWASQFDYIACQYKRQNGQLLNSPMSVVVQEIVDADVAGVMFTCDPVTGDPSRITITANYGIGESVVSATAEPDTITLKRDVAGDLQLESVTIGRKSLRTVLKDGGSCDETVSEDDASKCSLSDDFAFKLAKIGIMVEEAYGCRIDIEWALKDNRIFLLQARPVTTFDKETNFEIMHENNSSSRSENEWYTVANVGEVFPGATSNLGLSSANKFTFEVTMMRSLGRRDPGMFPHCPYYQQSFGYFANHLTLNLLNIFLRQYFGNHTVLTRAQHMDTLGRTIEDEDILQMATYRNKFYKTGFSVLQLFYVIKDMWTAGGLLKSFSETYRGLKLDLDHETSTEDMYNNILGQWLRFVKPFALHFQCTTYSSMANLLLFSVLVASNKGEWNQNVYNDVAYVLSSCNAVESVQVPIDIEKLAKAIVKDYGPGFDALESREALMWLERTDRPSGAEFVNFLKTNGHRCVKEFDIYSKPWGSDPLPLIKIIQDLVGKVDKAASTKIQVTTEETMKNLKSPLNWLNRLFMKIAIPMCRNAVGYRESSKSLMISLIHSLRGAYKQMAERMVLEGRLPSADLLYFLQHNEVLKLIKTRSPSLVQKAIRRRNLFPEMDKIVLPEIMQGFPVPINFDTKEIITEGSLCVKGVPVSQGVAVGSARVATSLKEAAEIQPGEILIAYSTDIGWSPYFPLLAGVATELGGLISHGAVIAREYGLPCVVAAQGATRQFRTGDKIQIDGNKGTITRLD